jgi:transcription termination factor NusB
MKFAMKATVEISMDFTEEEMTENPEKAEEYRENWSYMPMVVQEILEKNLDSDFDIKVTLDSLDASLK